MSYLGGLMDGDGSFSVSVHTVKGRRYFQVCVHFTNTNLALVEYVQKTIGFGNILEMHRYRSQQKPRWKPAYKLHYSSRQARIVAKMLLPYLIAKRRQAEIIANWPLKRYRNQPGTGRRLTDPEVHDIQEKLWLECKALNKRGRDVPPTNLSDDSYGKESNHQQKRSIHT